MRGLSLYTGSGAMDVAAIAAGVDVVALREADPWLRGILALRFPGVPCYDSDTVISLARLAADGIARPDIVFGGPPCQEFSMAGKRLGSAGPRNRFPEYLRIIRELQPRWIVAENVAGLRSADQGRYIHAVLWELAEMGYRVGWGHWGAADVGAPHERQRIFLCGRLMGDTGYELVRARADESRGVGETTAGTD